jgi:hypothetical protein
LLEASKEENKQVNPVEIHEEDNPTSPKKNRGPLLRSKINKKNLVANNVVHKNNVPTKKRTLL